MLFMLRYLCSRLVRIKRIRVHDARRVSLSLIFVLFRNPARARIWSDDRSCVRVYIYRAESDRILETIPRAKRGCE